MASAETTVEKEQNLFEIPMPDLQQCFSAILDKTKINIDINAVEFIVKSDLKIDIDGLDSLLIKILPYMFVTYVKVWPGWDKSADYYTGRLAYKEWYERFRQFIIYKINFLIEKGFQEALKEVSDEVEKETLVLSTQDKPAMTDASTQFERLSRDTKPLAPFSIEVLGPPKLLNTLIFTNVDDDVLLKFHDQKDCPPIQLNQLLNWLYVEVELKTPEFKFSRKMKPQYLRFLIDEEEKRTLPKQNFIQRVKKVGVKDGNDNRKKYASELLSSYVTQYIALLKKSDLVSDAKITEIQSVMNEFLKDVKEVCKDFDNYMPDKTQILFNIGGRRYIRNKKANRPPPPRDGAPSDGKDRPKPSVGFCEVIVTKCELLLNEFSADQDTSVNSDEVSFTKLNELFKLIGSEDEENKSKMKEFLPVTVYYCGFCLKQFDSEYALDAMMRHLKADHKMEHPALCYDCRKGYTLMSLTDARWYHKCPKYKD